MPQLDAAALSRQHYNATLVHRRLVHENLLVFRVRPDGGLPRALPGQFTFLGLGVWERQVPGCPAPGTVLPGDQLAHGPFSISSPILDPGGRLLEQEESFEFYVTLDRTSREESSGLAFTRRLFALATGDRLWMSGEAGGNYTLHPVQPRQDLLFLATGTGEAPHNRMLWDLVRRGHEGRIAAVTCTRYRKDLAYREVYAALRPLAPRLTYLPMTTREAGGPRHRIQEFVRSAGFSRRTGLEMDPARTHVFLCGHPAMVGRPRFDEEPRFPLRGGVVEALEQRFGFLTGPGDGSGNIHFERY